MNQTHLPRSLIILLFILVTATFIVGTLRTFTSAHAATVLNVLAQKTNLPSAGGNMASNSTLTADFPSPGPTLTPPPTFLLPPPTPAETLMPTPPPTLTPTPIPEPEYIADTTGIIALVILLVFVMLVGMAWGLRGHRNEKEIKK
jgi:hypothetical protein